MEGQLPFQVTVYDQDFQRVGTVGAPRELDVVVRRNAAGSAVFTLDADHRRVPDLMDEGARCVITYRHAADAAPRFLISGYVHERAGGGGGADAVRSFTLVDDWSLLLGVLGWPNPGGTLAQQGANGAYRRVTGPAETVVKTLIAENVSRLGLPVTVAPDQGRGASVDVQVRMHPLVDRLFPAVDQAGVVVEVRQDGAGLVVDVREPATYPHTLTEASGVIVDGSFSLTPPTATRAVVGGGGEGVDRVFRGVIDTARETAEWGSVSHPYVRERFVDARDVEPTDGDAAARLDARAEEAIAEGAPRSSLKVELAETRAFRFGKTVDVGDVAAVQLTGAPVLTDAVREVQLKWSTSDGVEVTPRIGEWNDSATDQVIKLVARALRGVRNLEAGR